MEMEERKIEQRCAIKFCIKLGETGIETFNKLKQAYGEHALSRSQVFKWYKAFSEGRESIKDEPRSVRPSTSKTDNNVEIVRALMRSDRWLTVRMIAIELNLNHTTVHQILTEELTIADNWMLHPDNAPTHTAISVIEFLAKKGIPVVPQPPYSPDLSPCVFFLFPKLNFHLKGRHFGTVENIEKAVTDQLKAIPVSDYQRCYEERE